MLAKYLSLSFLSFSAFGSIVMTYLLISFWAGAVFIPWDGTPSEYRPDTASFGMQVNNFFESGTGNAILFSTLAILLLFTPLVRIVLRKKERLQANLLHVIATNSFFISFTVFAAMISAFVLPTLETNFYPHRAGIFFAAVLALIVGQMISFNAKK